MHLLYLYFGTSIRPYSPNQSFFGGAGIAFGTMDDEKGNEESQVAREVIDRYSLFTTAEKWCIIGMVAYAAWFSTLSSFIYFPALHLLSETFGVSVAKINLTITSYMAIATIAPTLVGDAADVGGRRLVYVITLSLYIGANIGIALSKSYHALLGLRVLQALAISGKLVP
jgi:Major Facilitator Superfamily